MKKDRMDWSGKLNLRVQEILRNSAPGSLMTTAEAIEIARGETIKYDVLNGRADAIPTEATPRSNAKPKKITAVCHTCLARFTECKVYHSARVAKLPECRAQGHDVRETN